MVCKLCIQCLCDNHIFEMPIVCKIMLKNGIICCVYVVIKYLYMFQKLCICFSICFLLKLFLCTFKYLLGLINGA